MATRLALRLFIPEIVHGGTSNPTKVHLNILFDNDTTMHQIFNTLTLDATAMDSSMIHTAIEATSRIVLYILGQRKAGTSV